MKPTAPPPPTWAALQRPGRPSAWPVFLVALFLLLGRESLQAQSFDGLRYTVNANSSVTITGFDCASTSTVVIPDRIEGLPVAAIGDYAFYQCTGLTSVTIPGSVISIGKGAFMLSVSLSNLTLPDRVIWIQADAFANCSGLTSVTIPSRVTSIENHTFAYCTRLTRVTIPDSVTGIGKWAFYWCSSLTNVTIPNSVASIGDNAFDGCTGLTNVTIGNSVARIGFSAFEGCTGLTSVTIPNSVTSIGPFAFARSTGLTNVTIPNSVSRIEGWAFSECSGLTSVTIPNSVTSIGNGAFESCGSLKAIEVEALNPAFSSVGGALFNLDHTTLIACPSGKTGNYTIPNSVTRIAQGAFRDCSGLTGVTIGNSVTSIGDWTFAGCTGLTGVTIGNRVTSIGSVAFRGCIGLTAIEVDGTNPAYSSVEGVLFDKNQTTLIACPGGKVGRYTIPNSVTGIGSYAFDSCKSLTRVTIPDSVNDIESAAFLYCTSLTAVHFEGNAPTGLSDGVRTADRATVYYLPGTTGWGATFGGRPTALWQPQVLSSGPSFGVQTNRFGFTNAWAADRIVVVEASADLARPAWSPVGTYTLTGGSAYFSNSQPADAPARFYRLRGE